MKLKLPFFKINSLVFIKKIYHYNVRKHTEKIKYFLPKQLRFITTLIQWIFFTVFVLNSKNN